MHRKVYVVLGVIVLVLFAPLFACTAYNEESTYEIRKYYSAASTLNINNELESFVELAIQKDYSKDYSFITTITNNSHQNIYFNPFEFSLEYFVEGRWMNIDYSHWRATPAPMDVMDPSEQRSFDVVHLNFIPYDLERGLYRIRKTISNSDRFERDTRHDLVVEFEL